MANYKEDLLTTFGIETDGEVQQSLQEGAKWAKFIAICMFVCAAMLVIVVSIGGPLLFRVFSQFNSGITALGAISSQTFLLMAIIVVGLGIVVIYYFLYAFATKIKAALLSQDKAVLNLGIKNLKIFFIITSIISIIGLLGSVTTIFNFLL
jgi:hypothetical protein